MSFFGSLFHTKKPLGSFGAGNVRSLFRWENVERDGSRAYVFGDDTTRINRKTTAKYNDVFVDVLAGEQSLRVLLCVDFTKNLVLKHETLSLALSLVFDELAYRHHSMGWSLAKQWVIETIPSTKKPHMWHTVLDGFSSYSHDFGYSSRLYEQLLACTKLSSRSFIVLVGDFLAWDERCLSLYSYIAERHTVVWLVVGVPTYFFLGLPFTLRMQKISLPFPYVIL